MLQTPYNPPREPHLDIVYEDRNILVLNKQSGLLTVPGNTPEKHDSLETRVQGRYRDALTVHRLDMETSGVIIFGRSQADHRDLSIQFQDRKTDKAYVATVYGRVEEDEGEVALPLRCDWPNRPKQMVDLDLGKPSLTRYSVQERLRDRTRVLLTPVTGRSHQLRVHMLALGHPILGDPLYATGLALEAADRLLLHAEHLSVTHPASGERMTFAAPVPF